MSKIRRIIFSVRRHEEKIGDDLTPQGFQNAIDIGKSIPYDGNFLEVRTSPLKRAQKTGSGILMGYFSGAPGYERPVSYEMKPDEIAEHLREVNPPLSEDLEKTLSRDGILNHWLENEYILPDGTFGTAYQAGANVLYKIGREIQMEMLKKNESRYENITHAPNIENALIELLHPVGNMFIKQQSMRMTDIGGSFKTGENFEIIADYKSFTTYPKTVVQYRGEKPQKCDFRPYLI